MSGNIFEFYSYKTWNFDLKFSIFEKIEYRNFLLFQIC